MAARRQAIVELLRAGHGVKETAEQMGVDRKTVSRVRDNFEVTGTVKRKVGSGGHNAKRSEEVLTGLACEIEASPTTSMRQMAKNLDVSARTIRRAVKDLGAFSYVRRRRQLLSDALKARRLDKGTKLLNWLKSQPRSTIRIFSDKKNWTVDQKRNARNDRFLAYHVEDVPPIMETKHPASAMMLGVVASDGKRMPPHWFPCGLRVGTKEYLEVMKDVVKPWLDANYPDGNYVWQQDSAPSHRATRTQNWCRDNLANFLPWTKWPPSSPDLNPLDYGIWGNVERKACAAPHPNVASLKAAVEQEWTNMSEDFVVKTCRAFRPRLEAMIAAKGGHFEQ